MEALGLFLRKSRKITRLKRASWRRGRDSNPRHKVFSHKQILADPYSDLLLDLHPIKQRL